MRIRWAVGALWVCFIVRGIFYSALLPTWEGWDEFSHFAYLQHLYNTGELPDPNQSRPSREISESLRIGPVPWTLREISSSFPTHDEYWQLTSPERSARQARQLALPKELQAIPAPEMTPIYEAQQPPLYYWLLLPAMDFASGLALPSRIFMLRILSIAITSVAIPVGFLVARKAFDNDVLAIGATALITVMPVFAIDVARVGNEGPAVVLYTVLLLLTLRFVDGKPGRFWGVWAGIVLGCGLLTKAYFLTAVPALLLVCGWAVWTRRVPLKIAATQTSVAIGLACALAAWWYVYIRSVTGSLSGQIQAVAAREATLADRLRAITEVNWAQALDTVLISHIWFGAASFLQVRSWMYHMFGIVAVLAFVGLGVLLLRRKGAAAVPTLGVFLAAFAASLAYHVIVTYLLIHQSMTNGWYLYCLVFAEVCLLGVGLLAIAPRQLHKWVMPAGATLFAALDLYGVHFLLAPYYTGLTRHTPTGRMETFHLGQLAQVGWSEIVYRFFEGRPYLPGSTALITFWGTYLAATLAACVIAFACARSRTDKRGLR